MKIKLRKKADTEFVIPVLSEDPETAVTLGTALRHMQAHDPAFLKEEAIDPVALEIGAQIRKARLHAKLTQKQLAEASGIQQGAISDIERGKGKDGPSYRTVKMLAEALHADLALNPRESDGAAEAEQAEHVLCKVDNGGTLTLTDVLVGSGALLGPILRSALPELVRKAFGEKLRLALKAARAEHGPSEARPRSEVWALKPHSQVKVQVSEPSFVLVIDGPAVVTGRDLVSDRVAFVSKADALQLANTGGTAASVLAVPVDAPFLRDVVGV